MGAACSYQSSLTCFQRKPEVFVSFRSEDLPTSFSGDLSAALHLKKIDPYIDCHPRKGDVISPAVLSAIQNSKISVIIFTESYASSRRCLDLLTKIIDCKERLGQFVVPVFYNIDPSVEGQQKGRYQDAFAEHKLNFKNDLGKVQKWGEALSKAANITGILSTTFGPDLIEAIVQDLMQKLDDYLNGPVGIDEQIASVESLFTVKTIGLWGLGGIGKTTTAAALFQKISSQYELSCFMANVKEEWERFGANHLWESLLAKLTEQNTQIYDPFIRKRTLKRIQCKRVLIVLDDLNDSKQLDYILRHMSFGPGSRVVATSQDRQVLNKVDEVYNVQGMDCHKALQLFSLFAFKHKCPPTVYTGLSQRVISFAAGNPLALKLCGAYFGGKSIREWETALQKLDKIPNLQILDMLRLSYESLHDHEKNIFLDIACFFKGEKKDRIIVLLDSCGLSAGTRLKALQDKALITICNNEVWMHDLVQEMGRQIVHEKCIDDPGRQSKLWDPDVIHHVLKSNTGSEAVEGMFFDMSKINEVCINTDVFNTMYNLRFLRFQAFNDKRCSMQLFGDLHFLPNKLRILHWEGYPLKSLPSTYCPEKLIELNLSRSRIERLWDGVVNLHNLRSINLSFCKYLVKIPDLSQALSLESIDVEDCTSLCHLPPSIFNADSLTTINARGCRGFTSFCSDTRSKSLERINLSGCTSLAVLSVTSENIKFLDLSETAIKELSPPFGCLNKLTELYLRDCKSLQHIPDRISQSEILEILDASNCFNLSKVPNQLSKLTSLYRLSLSASCIENFPTTIKDLSLLKHLELRDCKRLQHLPELPPFIQWIDARSCISLETMSNLHSTTKSIQDCFLISKEELLKRFEGGYSEEVFFYDCIKLDQSAFCGLLEGSRCRIQRAAFVSSLLDVSQVDNILIRICLPGSEVPDWFNIQALETSICCQLPAHSAVDLKILRFAFCIVVDTSPWNNESHGKALTLEVGYKFCFAGMKQQWIGYSTDVHLTQPSSREHLCMWYDDLFCRGIMDRIGNRSNV